MNNPSIILNKTLIYFPDPLSVDPSTHVPVLPLVPQIAGLLSTGSLVPLASLGLVPVTNAVQVLDPQLELQPS